MSVPDLNPGCEVFGHYRTMTALSEWLTDPDEPTRGSGTLSPYLFRYMGADGLLFTVRDQTLRIGPDPGRWTRGYAAC